MAVRGSIFTGGTGGVHVRQKDDFYATPAHTVKALLDNYPLKGNVILEPACGMGHISKVLKEYYPDKKIISTDLVYRGYGEGGIDFLTHKYTQPIDTIITNPPFKLAREFAIRGLELAEKEVILLLKIQFLESEERKEFLENSPLKYVYVFSNRQNTMRDGLPLNPRTGKKWSSTLLLAWFVWDVSYTGEPTIRWLLGKEEE